MSKITRVLLKTGVWNTYDIKYMASTEPEDDIYRILHMGYLGNLYYSYELLKDADQNSITTNITASSTTTNTQITNTINNTNTPQNSCIVLVDDIHKPKNNAMAERMYDELLEDLRWLRIPNLKIICISQKFDIILTYLSRLISMGQVFLQIFSGDGDFSSKIKEPEEIHKLFLKVVKGIPLNFRYSILKFRLNLPESKNPLLMALRDKETAPYVSLNFSIIVSDMTEGVNLLLQDQDSLLSNEIIIFYDYIFGLFQRQLPKKVLHQGYKIVNFKYYREKIQTLIKSKYFDGWDDPKLLTIAGLRRRGIPPQVIQEFCKRGNKVPEINIQYMNKCLMRYFKNIAPKIKLRAILEPIKVKILNMPIKTIEYILPNQSSYDTDNLIPFSDTIYVERSDINKLREGFRVNLKNGYAIRIEKKVYDLKGMLVEIHAKYLPESIPGAGLQNEMIPWLSYDDPDTQIWVKFYLYSQWYLNGFPDRDISLAQALEIPIYRGLLYGIKDIKTVVLDESIVYINRLGYFKYDEKKTQESLELSFNLVYPLPKIERIIQQKNYKM